MKTLLFRLLLLVDLLHLCLGDATTEVHLDIPASLSFGNGPKLFRVEKVVDVTYTYNLHPNGVWTQFPDMKIIIDLPFGQYVKLHYNIAIVHNVPNHLATRIRIDGVENRHTRRHTAEIRCPSVFYDSEIYMGKGQHTIVLEYRTMISHHQDPNWDWSIALFKVSYHILENQ